jgi:hypothetical protein
MTSLTAAWQRVTGTVRGDEAARRRDLYLLVAVVAGSILFSVIILAGQGRLAISLAVGTILFGMAILRPPLAIIGTFVLVSVVGDLRRLLISMFGWTSEDPILLVGPFMVAFLFAAAFAHRKISFDTPLSRWVVLFLAILAIQVFNPAQGSLALGIAGALFYIVPVLWYFVGRAFLTRAAYRTMLLYVVMPITTVAAVMGIYQSFYGYLPHQVEWFLTAGYVALQVRGTLRPISIFPSSAEFLAYMLCAIAIIGACFFKNRKAFVLLLPLPVLAIFFSGSRGPIVYSLFVVTVLWAVQGRTAATWVPRLVLAAFFGVLGLVMTIQSVGQMDFGGPVQGAVEHQVKGLLNPLDSEQSTAGLHFRMMMDGYKKGFTQPLGSGLGSTTLAAGRFGGSAGHSTEVDLSNVFVSTGAFGGIVYLIIVFLVFRSAVIYWRKSRDFLALAALGILAVTFGTWLIGSHYSVTMLIWLSIGIVDRLHRDYDEAAAAEDPGDA